MSHRVLLPDGDTTILHDDRPADWQPTSPTALLIHGLAGCHRSSYMVHAAGRLNEAGVRTFRMDMRACGAAERLSRRPYHGGCSHDVLVALKRVAEICPVSSITLVGFSIGGNAALKMAGESPNHLPPQLSRLVAICPPIDLEVCIERVSKFAAGLYDRYLASAHYRKLRRSEALTQHAPHVVNTLRPHGQRDFDNWYTAAVWGFETADQFYAATSSSPMISEIRVPTLVIASRDDPLVPVELFQPLEPLTSIALHLSDYGGHLGFIGRRGPDPGRHWLDWRIVDWITAARTAPSVAAA